MAHDVEVALAQWEMRPLEDFRAFCQQANALLDQAAGAHLVVFPETFTFSLITTEPGWKRLKPRDLTRVSRFTDDYMEFFGTAAARRAQHIVAGSHLLEQDGRYLNVGHLFEPDGTIRRHTKTHIFPTEADWRTEEGDELELWDLGFVSVGLMICYEAEVPECATALHDMGADLIVCPSYTFTEYGFWRVRHSCHARAIENQVFVAHCCATGDLGGPLPSAFARSSILAPCDIPWAPNGVVAEADTNIEMVVHAAVSLDALHSSREVGAAPTHRDRRRRAHVYKRWAEGGATPAASRSHSSP